MILVPARRAAATARTTLPVQIESVNETPGFLSSIISKEQ